MDYFKVKKNKVLLCILLLFVLHDGQTLADTFIYDVQPIRPGVKGAIDLVLIEHDRYRRDAPIPEHLGNVNSTYLTINTTTTATVANTTLASTTETVPEVNKTTEQPAHTAVVTVTPPLSSFNVSADDDISDIFKETPETIKAKENLSNLTFDSHSFYNSTFLGNVELFNELWSNITKDKAEVHDILSHSHRRATTIRLSFDFPFYGHNVTNITVATGGFIYIGEHVHNWLAATQYIAPLMANFDTTLSNDSLVKHFDDVAGEKFIVFWENVTLQEDPNKKFTFAVILYKNGDITFAYKDIPTPVQSINDNEHPVKVGISDAYLTDRNFLHLRRKTIYEYHRVSFKNYEIANKTILKLIALPTCLQYDTCESCVNHDTNFNCSWCEVLQKCSSRTDKHKQDWILRHCDQNASTQESTCPAPGTRLAVPTDTDNTAYTTDTHNGTNMTDNVVKAKTNAINANLDSNTHSPAGGVIVAFVVITIVCSLAAWVFTVPRNGAGDEVRQDTRLPPYTCN
ncbi:unnamed protein product [Leptidea sinapis]|uniref:PSI domain-containing protein n=1 Tax=Leptidea sinapis TaxID=189913 RepID=A0A5E4PMG0_9NEOP|nr:unnamed protein product [Leptidea sinapis]